MKPRANPDLAYEVPAATSPERLSGACILSLVDARGWPMDVTIDQLVDHIAAALGDRRIERLSIKQLFLDLPGVGAGGSDAPER